MAYLMYLVYLVVGLAAGVVGGLLGTGGCALMMPVIRFGFHFDPALAVGTTLTAVVFTAGSGAVQHIRMGNVDRKSAWITGGSGILGVILGSIVFAYVMPYGSLIDLIIGCAFLLVTLRMLYEGGKGLFGKNPMPQPAAGEGMPGTPLQKGALGTAIGILTGEIRFGASPAVAAK